MKHNTFAVARFENRNSVISWRVSGFLHGVRIRKNFKSKEAAAAEKATLELQAVQDVSGLRAVTTALTVQQLREAEAAFLRLQANPRSLMFYLDYALTNYREPQCLRSLAEAADEYLAAKRREHEQQVISSSQLTTIRRHLAMLQQHFRGNSMAELTAPRLTAYFERGNPALKTYNNRRGIGSGFLKFALQRDWIAANPITETPLH